MTFKKLKLIIILSLVVVAGYGLYLKNNLSEKDDSFDSSSIKVISHRGANDRYPEHTLLAYEQAIKDKADYIEIDLRITKDNHLIAMHDDTVDRTTNGSGNVSDYTLEEIKKIRTIYRENQSQETVPTMEEIIKKFGKTTKYYIELRDLDDKPVMVEKLSGLLKQYDLLSEKYIILQSFSDKSLDKSKILMPNIPLTKLYKSKQFDIHSAIESDVTYIGIEAGDVSKKHIKKLTEQGKKVHVYFLDKKSEKKEQELFYKEGIDGFFTDYNVFTINLMNSK